MRSGPTCRNPHGLLCATAEHGWQSSVTAYPGEYRENKKDRRGIPETKTGERGAGAETGVECSISGFLGGVSLKP